MPTEKQLEALAKARAAQKKNKAPEKAEEQPKPAAKKKAAPKKANTAPPKEMAPSEPQEPDISKGAERIVEKIRNDGKVRFYLPPDPQNPQIKTWERSFNGHFVCLKVGHTYDLPEFIVDYIAEHLKIIRETDERYATYTAGAGRRLG